VFQLLKAAADAKKRIMVFIAESGKDKSGFVPHLPPRGLVTYINNTLQVGLTQEVTTIWDTIQSDLRLCRRVSATCFVFVDKMLAMVCKFEMMLYVLN